MASSRRTAECGSRLWERLCAATAVAISSRRRWSMGIAQVLLGCAEAVPVGRGHANTRGKKGLLRNGPELRDGAVVQAAPVPRLGRMFIARPSGGLWHF